MSNTSRSSFNHTEHFNFIIILIKSGVHQLPSIASFKRLCEQWPSLQITNAVTKNAGPHGLFTSIIFLKNHDSRMGFEDINSAYSAIQAGYTIKSHTELNVISE